MKCVKFPIKEHVKMKAAPVLSINQSFQILLSKYNGMSWDEALRDAIPLRKRFD